MKDLNKKLLSENGLGLIEKEKMMRDFVLRMSEEYRKKVGLILCRIYKDRS